MLRKVIVPLLLVSGGVLGSAEPAAAQQTLNFTLGYFTVLGEDARIEQDVINVNRTYLEFDVPDFNSLAVGGEWLVPVGRFIEAGAGIGFSRRTVHSNYRDFVDRDGSEIEQDLRLRMLPIAFTARVLPLSQESPVQPYFGGGIAVITWRYSESGEFIDFDVPSLPVFRDTFAAEGTEAGPVVLGGVRFAGDAASFGGEVRYQRARADVGPNFAGPRLDLGGWSYQVTLGVRFGQ
jgi:hypothetical protein